jgi:hypothetical protein
MIYCSNKSSQNTTLAEESFINQMEQTIENIIGHKTIHKQLLTQDIVTIIEYNGLTKIITSNNLIFSEKHKSIYIYCIIRNSQIETLDFSQICDNNVIKKFNIFLMYKEHKIPEINATNSTKINIISYNDLSY